jgi:Holliday junction resolvasome RuvABC endonuclease subunit
MSIILGIDPGTTTTGFAVIKSEKGKIEILEF